MPDPRKLQPVRAGVTRPFLNLLEEEQEVILTLRQDLLMDTRTRRSLLELPLLQDTKEEEAVTEEVEVPQVETRMEVPPVTRGTNEGVCKRTPCIVLRCLPLTPCSSRATCRRGTEIAARRFNTSGQSWSLLDVEVTWTRRLGSGCTSASNKARRRNYGI